MAELSRPLADAAPADSLNGAAVTCTELAKDYGQGRGVFDLDLTICRGEVFGFVGPNGAGKTTTIRLLMDLIRPDRGTATVLGLDVHRDAWRSSAGWATCRGSWLSSLG